MSHAILVSDYLANRSRQEVLALSALIGPLCTSGVLVGSRFIGDGDENALLPDEITSFGHSIREVRRQSGAARIIARTLLRQLNVANAAIPRGGSRAPVWPPGTTGSLAHERHVAVAAVARTADVVSVGIDIEQAVPLPRDVARHVATPTERRRHASSQLNGCRLFVVKEAVYKAVHPIDGVFLNFHDIDVDLDACVAHVTYGRTVPFALVCGSHIVALARIDR